jgi:hypothetical protein
MPSRSRSRSRVRIPIHFSGVLSKFGYSDIKHMSTQGRHLALAKAVKSLGSMDVIRRLNAIATLQKNTHPSLSRKMRADQRWVSKHTTK